MILFLGTDFVGDFSITIILCIYSTVLKLPLQQLVFLSQVGGDITLVSIIM